MTATPHHMPTPWHDLAKDEAMLAKDAPLEDKTAIVHRVGILLLSAGTGAWRVRDAMNSVATALGVTYSAELGLLSIELTCTDGSSSVTQVATLPTAGVNTERIMIMESLAKSIVDNIDDVTVGQIHSELDLVECRKQNYSPAQAGLASAAACAAFVFLLGGGPVEMICAFVGAGLGNWSKRLMGGRHLNQLTSVAVAVSLACVGYLLALRVLSLFMPDAMSHAAGYIGAMLFVIPGFPLITSGLDFAKLDMRSGIERLAYALAVILVATLVGWVASMVVQLAPDAFVDLGLSVVPLIGLRLVMSFVGVFGFSIMFNSTPRMALTAGLVGGVANTLRLELTGILGVPIGAAAFLGALCAGLLASWAGRRLGFPRISLTVPSIVIMVPGLYMYRAVWCMGASDAVNACGWLFAAAMIVAFLPIGLAAARVITDERWRRCS